MFHIDVCVRQFIVPVLRQVKTELIDVAFFKGLEYLGRIPNDRQLNFVEVVAVFPKLIVDRPPVLQSRQGDRGPFFDVLVLDDVRASSRLEAPLIAVDIVIP